MERHGRPVAAFEMKARRRVSGADLAGRRAFAADHPGARLAVVAEVPDVPG